MLFRRDVLDRIVRGDVTLAFRRWKRPTVKAGGRLRTAVGVLRIGEVRAIEAGDLADGEARKAGYVSRDAALADLGGADRGVLYRIALDRLEPDERVLLRDRAKLSEDEWAGLRKRFDRWEKAAQGHFPAILQVIARKPAVAASILAADLATETLRFKQDVRKLKELGLTESLDTGYRLSPRGDAVLVRLMEQPPH